MYKICPNIKYLYDCKTIEVYNDIYSDNCTITDVAETLSSVSFTISNVSDETNLTASITAIDVNGQWGLINYDDFTSYLVSTLTQLPVNGATYTVRVNYTDNTNETASYTSGPLTTWAIVFSSIESNIAFVNCNILYNEENNCLYISSGNKEISSVVITSGAGELESSELSSVNNTLDNGVYEFVINYTLSDNSTGQIIVYKPIFCKIKQCILRLISRIKELQDCNKCNDDCIDYIITANSIMESLNLMEINNQSDIDKAIELIDRLEDICINEDCQCYD